ncbi:MAG: Vitamin B12 ABC transporter, substrate-binding protein BtuF [Burkholderiaceae bacterium]|jgi:iron complex transport system substrate-binding protein|nr:MAG: Vitamin B12 ABC transporter, substrate-binding protein BtuF [Burkholderiaceae bacterium]
MVERRAATPVLYLVALLLWALAGAAHAYSIRDDSGVVTHFNAPPSRIVSLLPSLTETVCALGACDRLVGVDRYSNWPASVRKLPSVGGGLDPSLESVVVLRPDLVLMSVSSPALPRLRGLGLRVIALDTDTARQMRHVIVSVGQALQQPDPERLVHEIDADVAAVAKSLPPPLRGESVYFEVSPGPYAAGPGSFIGELLARLGLRNIIGPELGLFPKINPELVVRADPDLIMVGTDAAGTLADRPGWAGLRALTQHRVCAFDAAQFDVLVRPGPRMAEAARLIAACVLRFGPGGGVR